MLTRIMLAAAAIVGAGSALADNHPCLQTPRPGCTMSSGDYESVNGVPVGVPDVVKGRKFVVENFVEPGIEDVGKDARFTDNIYYWDGRAGHLVSRETGPLVVIADF